MNLDTSLRLAASVMLVTALAACAAKPSSDRVRASGSVEATEVQLSAKVGGTLMDLKVAEGDRVVGGQLIAQLDTTDTELALRRAHAERNQAAAQLRLLEAGARVEEIRQAEAQLKSNEADAAAPATKPLHPRLISCDSKRC